MKKIFIFTCCVIWIIFLSCSNNAPMNRDTIKVGVFDKNGDAPYCIADAVEALKIDKDIDVRIISSPEIMTGVTKELDVILFPGGSGRAETGNLGKLGQQKIIDFVKKEGKVVIGICAGAYVLTKTPDYPSLDLSGGAAIDLEHDNRGHGIAKFSLTEKGKEIFPELINREINFSQYYEGPVLIPAKDSKYKYNELATMESDVHTVDGAPANMTNNRPFIIMTDVEKGKSVSVVGHPESTPGMRWMIPRLVRVALDREIIPYKKEVVKPEYYTKEILFTKELLEKQEIAYYNLRGTKEEKIQAMNDLVNMCAWSAKKWIPEMLRDNNSEVRVLAAKLTRQLERTDAIPDLAAAVKVEKNIEYKEIMQKELTSLKNIISHK